MKDELYEKLWLSPLDGFKYKLLIDFKYKDVVVPANYTTNGANIPRLLWFIFPPNESDIMPAIVVHDYLCDLEEYDKADEYLKEMLEILDVSKFQTYSFYYSCKLYHKIRY